MRESIGTSWLFGLVLSFILLFAGFLVLIINYSEVFMFKNEVLEIIENYEGYTEKSKEIIDSYLLYSSYKTTGTCPTGYYGVTSLDGSTSSLSKSTGTKNAYYCIKASGSSKYDIIIFYSFNLPVIGDVSSFSITGQTNTIQFYDSVSYLLK